MRPHLLLLSLMLCAASLGAQIVIPPTVPVGPPPPSQPPANPPGAINPINPIYQEWRDANQAKRDGNPRWNAFYDAAGGYQSADAYVKAQAAAEQPQVDPFMQYLFPPELVMAHQREINLQDAQRTKLVLAMNAAQAKFTESEWTLSGEQDKLQQLVQGTSIDEAAVEKQLDRILSMENDLKRSQLLLMVRVKNALTPEQQGILATFRPAPCAPAPPPAPGTSGAGFTPRKKADGTPAAAVEKFGPVMSEPCGPMAKKKGPGGE